VVHHALAGATPRREVHGVWVRGERDGRGGSDSAARRDPAGADLGWEGTEINLCVLCVLCVLCALCEKQKRGRRSPPFLAGRGSLTLLAALLLPALCSLL